MEGKQRFAESSGKGRYMYVACRILDGKEKERDIWKSKDGDINVGAPGFAGNWRCWCHGEGGAV